MKRTAIATALAGLVAGAPLAARAAEEFPARPMTYIIPFDRGGESGISARFQQAEWEEHAGQPVEIRYQPGEGGARAWSQLNRIAGDGHTIMGINLPHTVLQPLEGDVGYRTEDLTPVNYFHYTPNAVLVPKDSAFRTLEDLVAHAKANPGRVTFSGSGANSANRLAQVRFDELAGVATTYIPFSGTGPAMTAVLDGEATAGFNYPTSALEQEEAVRMLAITAEERLPAFPDVPTFRELGYPLVGGAYRGVAVPAATPEEIRRRISDIVSAINADPDFVAKMEEGGFVLTDIPYGEMEAFMSEMTRQYTEAAEHLGIEP